MFWSDIREAYRGISLNAGLIRFFVEDLEETECKDTKRVERITRNIENEVTDCLMRLRAVPELSDLFMKHYEDPAGLPAQRQRQTQHVSHK